MRTTSRYRLLIVLLVLALAALACNLPGSAGDDEQPTVTPSPGPTLEPTEPTAEPTAEPTQEPPTQEPTGMPPSACPAPGDASLPTEPPIFADYYTTIQSYLSQGGSVENLESTLRAWGSIVEPVDTDSFAPRGQVVADADLTGDGNPEVIVVVQAPPVQFPEFSMLLPGDIYIYSCKDGAYRLLYADYSELGRLTPAIITVANITASDAYNVVYTASFCGAHTCFVQIYALAYDPASDQMVDLLDENEGTAYEDGGIPYGEVNVADTDADGVSEILVGVGAIGSVGAGPQRTYLNTFRWDGTRYVLAESTLTSEGVWPIHHLQDGDAAAEAGDYTAALAFYQQVLDDPAPLTWMDVENEILMLRRYARYRIMLMHVLLGDDANALIAYKALTDGVDLETFSPENGFPILGDMFWREYTLNGDIDGACRMVVDYAVSYPETYDILNLFGYANRNYEAADMCPYGK